MMINVIVYIKRKILEKELKIGKTYLVYFIGAILPQLLLLSQKGNLWDTLWKGLVVVTFISYLLLKRKSFDIQNLFIIGLSSYIVLQIVCLILLPQYMNIKIITIISSIIVTIIMVYSFFIFPYYYTPKNLYEIYNFADAYVLFMLYACVYNFIYNGKNIIDTIFSPSNAYYYNIASFFDNKNTFGLFLYMGIIATFFMYDINRQKKYLWFFLIFFISLVISLSRTPLFAAIVFIGIIIIFQLIKHKKNLVKPCIVTILIITVVYFIPGINDYINTMVMRKSVDLSSRENIWGSLFRALTGFRFIVGYGEGTTYALLTSLNQIPYSHNGFISVLISGGVPKLILYVAMILVTLKKSFFIYKRNKSIGIILIAALLSYFVYSMGEDLVLLSSTTTSIVASTFCVSFTLLIYNYYKKNEVVDHV